MISASASLAQGREDNEPPQDRTPCRAERSALHDLQYVTNGHVHQKLDLYLPKGNKKVPLIVFHSRRCVYAR
jgi:hypothetical protein